MQFAKDKKGGRRKDIRRTARVVAIPAGRRISGVTGLKRQANFSGRKAAPTGVDGQGRNDLGMRTFMTEKLDRSYAWSANLVLMYIHLARARSCQCAKEGISWARCSVIDIVSANKNVYSSITVSSMLFIDCENVCCDNSLSLFVRHSLRD